MILRRVITSLKHQDWAAVVVDFIIVIVGIFIGLQASLWVEARRDRATEVRYLERLLADSDENILSLETAIAVNDRRATTLKSLASALENGGQPPSPTDLSDVMCRWFVQPAVNTRRGTYAELVSSGRLVLLRDEKLRGQLALEQAAHDEAERLDIVAPAVFQAAAPLADFRQWRIDNDVGAGGVTCHFDIAGMRSDSRILSVVAQLYRDQTTHKGFRQRELDAVRASRASLSRLLGRGSRR